MDRLDFIKIQIFCSVKYAEKIFFKKPQTE